MALVRESGRTFWPRAAAGLLAFGLATLFLAQGLNRPFQKDQEAYIAGLVRDAAQGGHLLVPIDAYGRIGRKPPLYFWLSAAVAKGRGTASDEAASRLVSVAAGAALATFVMMLGWSAWNAWTGALAFCFLLGCYGFAGRAALAQVDMLFALWLFAALIATERALAPSAGLKWEIAAGVLLALAVLTKGPLALILVFLTIGVARTLKNDNPFGPLAQGATYRVAALGLGLALVWYGLGYLRFGNWFLTVHLGEENLGHFLPARMGGTGESYQPPYFILAKFIGGALPLAMLIPATIATLWTRRRALAGEPVLCLAVGLLLVVLIFFSLASAKRAAYVLPAFPALALILAWTFDGANRASVEVEGSNHRLERYATPQSTVTMDPASAAPLRNNRRTQAVIPAFRAALLHSADGRLHLEAVLRDGGALFIAILAVLASLGTTALATYPGLIAAVRPYLHSADAQYLSILTKFSAKVSTGLVAIVAAITGGIAMIGLGLQRRAPHLTGFGTGAIALAGTMVMLAWLRPALAADRSLKSFIAEARQIVGKAPLFSFGEEDYQSAFYWGAPIPLWRDGRTANRERIRTDERFFLLGRADLVRKFADRFGGRTRIVLRSAPMGSRPRVVLIEVRPEASDATRTHSGTT